MKYSFLAILVATLFIGCSQKNPKIVDDFDKVVVTQSVETTSGENRSGVDVAQKFPVTQKQKQQVATIYFNFNRYNIKPDMQNLVMHNARVLNGSSSNILLEGNCDERGSSMYNKELGYKRAKSVKDALINLGVNPSRISTVSFGKDNPVCTQRTSACMSKNRRVNIVLEK